MKVVVLQGSVRKGGNTGLLVQSFVRGAATLDELFDSIIAQYQLLLNYFKLEDAGRVLVRGAKEKGDVNDTDGIKQAYELGLSLR